MKALYMVFIIFGWVLISNAAEADEVGFIVESNHTDSDYNYNEKNNGLYIIKDNVILGTFKNSYNDQVYFLGNAQKINIIDNVMSASIWYGLSYGYGWNSGMTDAENGGAKFIPMIVPTVSIGYNGFKVNTHIVGNAIAWSVSVDF